MSAMAARTMIQLECFRIVGPPDVSVLAEGLAFSGSGSSRIEYSTTGVHGISGNEHGSMSGVLSTLSSAQAVRALRNGLRGESATSASAFPESILRDRRASRFAEADAVAHGARSGLPLAAFLLAARLSFPIVAAPMWWTWAPCWRPDVCSAARADVHRRC